MDASATPTRILRKPPLPKEFFGPSALGASALIGFMLITFAGPALVNYYVVTQTDLAWWWKLLACIPGALLAGNAVHLMGFIGHEGFHFGLHKNRTVSAVLGLLFSSMTIVFFQIGMALDHWTHHKLTNTKDDPDLQLLKHYKTFLSRFFLQRFRANRKYFRRTLMLASKRPIPAELSKIKNPMSRHTMRRLAWLNFAFAGMWLSVYVWIDSAMPGMFVIGFLIPGILGSWLSGIRSFVEHNQTTTGQFRDTRSRVSPIFTILHFGGNYHLEHHLYPTVPQWRLPRVHQYLKAQGVWEQLEDPSLIERGLFSGYRFATARYSYGELREQSPAGDKLTAAASIPG